MMDPLIVTVCIIGVATLIRAIFGFGDALFAMPILVLTLGLEKSAPLVAMMGAIIGIVMIAREWKHIQFTCAWHLVLGSFLGIPIGLLFVSRVNEGLVLFILATLLTTTALFNIFQPKTTLSMPTKATWIFGFLAGLAGGAYNTQGPVVVVFGTLKGWTPKQFRATLQGYFLPTTLCIVTSHIISGHVTPTIMKMFAFGLPGLIAALAIGGWINKTLSPARFQKALNALLLGIALLLFIKVF
ncbi:MAG: putative membrane protein YfcA [Candidatus Marinamargulisbacteria bacterium]|jgi:uncharacterized membrane protein YfcA